MTRRHCVEANRWPYGYWQGIVNGSNRFANCVFVSDKLMATPSLSIGVVLFNVVTQINHNDGLNGGIYISLRYEITYYIFLFYPHKLIVLWCENHRDDTYHRIHTAVLLFVSKRRVIYRLHDVF